MTTSSASLLLGLTVLLLFGPTVSAVSLNMSPDQQQFFRGESVRLSCEEEDSSAGWTLKRISVAKTETCGVPSGGFGRLNGSACIVSDLSPTLDRGLYWCEDASGQRSVRVSITVSDRAFILEIPALPVMAGSSVTLRCRNRNGSSISKPEPQFFRFGTDGNLEAAAGGHLDIRNVQLSDGGFYWCAVGQTVSASSMLSVQGPDPPSNSSVPLAASPLLILCHIVAVAPFCVSTGLMVSVLCSRRTGKTGPVTMETVQQGESEPGSERMYDSYAAAVTTEHDF